MRIRALAAIATAVTAGVTGLTGCTQGGSPAGAPVGRGPVIRPLPVPVAAAPVVGAGTTVSSVFRKTTDGVTLPNRGSTPGGIFTDVTRAEVCDPHYAMGVLSPHYNAKVLAFSSYGLSIHDRDLYEVDHLIPISLGGNNEIKNLWPQPYAGSRGAHQKDALEAQLRGLVCTGKLGLADAQHAVAEDWWSAYQRYMAIPVRPQAASPTPRRSSTPPPGKYPVVNGSVCPKAGVVGYTVDKHVRYTCTSNQAGRLQWLKRQ